MNELSQTLLLSTCLIGVYIAASLLFATPRPNTHTFMERQYHMGCYLDDASISYSVDIEKQIHTIKSKLNPITSYQMLRVDVQEIDSKSYEVALAVEDFLIDLNQFKETQSISVQITSAINDAAQEYQTCGINVLQDKFPEEYCQQTWNSYQSCSAKLNLYKTEIQKLLAQKQMIEDKISQAIPCPNSNLSSKEDIMELKWKEYQQKDKQILKQMKKIEANLIKINQKLTTAHFDLKSAESQVESTRKLFEDCTLNRKQFLLCQELSEDLKSLGYRNVTDLESKLDMKKASIMKMKVLLNGVVGDQRDSILKQQNISLEQFKKLYHIFTEIKLKSQKSCGCTQERQNSLLIQLEEHMNQKQQLENVFWSVKVVFLEYDLLSRQLQQNRTKLLTYYKNSSNSSPLKLSITKHEISQEEILLALKTEQSELNTNILVYEQRLHELYLNCQNNKKQLSSLLTKISQISTCLNKREYLTTLQQKYEDNKRKVQFSSFSKQRLIKMLKSFTI